MPPWPDSLVFRRVLGRELPTIARGEGVWLEDTEGRNRSEYASHLNGHSQFVRTSRSEEP